jgi:uncharacterized membrane protein
MTVIQTTHRAGLLAVVVATATADVLAQQVVKVMVAAVDSNPAAEAAADQVAEVVTLQVVLGMVAVTAALVLLLV